MKLLNAWNLTFFLSISLTASSSFAASQAFRQMAEANQAYHKELSSLDHPPTGADRAGAYNKAFGPAAKALDTEHKQHWENLKSALQKQYPVEDKKALAKDKDGKPIDPSRAVAGAPNTGFSSSRGNVKNDTGQVTASGGAAAVSFGGNKAKTEAASLPVQDGIIMQK